MTIPTTAEIGSLLATNDIEPWEYYRRVQDAGGVVWDTELRAWLVSSYELLKQMGPADTKLWESLFVYADQRAPWGMNEERWIEFMGTGSRRVLYMDNGSEHDRMHHWWMKAFSGRALNHLGDELVRPLAHNQIDRFIADGRADLDAEFATHVAPRIMAAAFGLPDDDDGWLERFLALQSDRMALIGKTTSPESRNGEPNKALIERGFAASHGIREMLETHVEERRQVPGDDLTSMMWAQAPELFGDDYSAVDIIAAVNTSFSGGSGTAGATTANGLYLLLTQPELQQPIRDGGRKALQSFVEETLRLHGPSVWRPRFATRNVTLGDAEIKKGDMVAALYNAGNRDARHYHHPNQVDLARSGTKDHYGFGLRGPRTCPGQGLARTQLATIFDVVLERLNDLRLDSSNPEPPRFRGSYVRRWRPLHALFTPTPRMSEQSPT